MTSDDDQRPYAFRYGHGRIPWLLKLLWLLFAIFAIYFIVAYVMASLGEELGA